MGKFLLTKRRVTPIIKEGNNLGGDKMKKYLLTILCNGNVYSVAVSVELTEGKLWYCFKKADGWFYISINRDITDIDKAVKVFCNYKYGLRCLGIKEEE